AAPGVHFFGYFLWASKESNPLARRASGSLCSEINANKSKVTGFPLRARGNDEHTRELDSCLTSHWAVESLRNDEQRAKPSDMNRAPRCVATTKYVATTNNHDENNGNKGATK
ncbi:MAG: hypothetical protein IJI03_07215, partial [Rudaea sp.]|nr:hypothetical protein [Rudaea sp.]